MTPLCAVCGSDRVPVRLTKEGVEIRECARCGLQFWLPEAGFDAAALYDARYFEGGELGPGYDDYAGLELALRSNFARRLATLPPPGRGARLLDVGAAYGFAVDEARQLGWEALGLEIAAQTAQRAGAVAGAGRMLAASALAMPFADASFSTVTLWDVLEHLPDPHAVAAEIARVLAPGGVVVLTTGDAGSLLARASGARWHLYTLPEHLFFFSRESLRRLLGAHGFRVEHVAAESSVYPVGYLVERLRKTLLGRGGGRSDWPGAGVRVPVNLFDIVTVRARKLAA